MVSKFGFLVVVTVTLLITSTFAERIKGLKSEEEEAINQAYAKTRALLGPTEMEFLKQILAADELIMERQQRGIVDQILASLSGTNSVGGWSILGPARVPQQAQAPAQTAAGAATPINNSNFNATGAQGPQQQQPQQLLGGTNNNDNYLFSQISKVVINSGTRNVTGIVDEALKIGTPGPIRDLVTSIVSISTCNGVRRLLGQCS